MLNIVNYYEQLVVDRLWKMAESGELPEGAACGKTWLAWP